MNNFARTMRFKLAALMVVSTLPEGPIVALLEDPRAEMRFQGVVALAGIVRRLGRIAGSKGGVARFATLPPAIELLCELLDDRRVFFQVVSGHDSLAGMRLQT